MPHPSTPIAIITLSFSVGILFREGGFKPSFFWLIGFAIALFISHFKKWQELFWVTLIGCFVALGIMRFPPAITVSASLKKQHEIEVIKALHTHSFGHQYLVKSNADELLLLETPLDNTFLVGDRYLIYGTLEPIPTSKNPAAFDFKTYMLRKGVSRKLTPVTDDFITLFPKKGLRRWAHKLQRKLSLQLQKSMLQAESKALVLALVLGNKADLSEERITQYKRAGAMHLLAISGLHIGVILMLLRFLVAPLKRIRYGAVLAAILPVILLWGFALITGGSPSVVRAVTMFSFLQLGLALKRKHAAIQGVWASCLMLLFAQPRLLFDVGFQLSYSAVFGIIWMMPHWQRLFTKTNRFIRHLTSLIGLGFIAQLSVLPLSLFYFHQFPLLFWMSNLVLVPSLWLIILCGIGCVIASFFSPLYWVFPLADALFTRYQRVVEWIAQWEGFFIDYIPFRVTDAILLGLAIAMFFFFLQKPNRQKAIVLGVLSLLFHVQLYFDWKQPPKAWVMHVYKNSLVVTTKKKVLIAHTANKTPKIERMTHQLKQHYRLDSILFNPLKQGYHDLLVVDSLGLYYGMGNYETILLRQSPKVHLGALIDLVEPSIVIADGSNYPTFIEMWEKTCIEKNITFHATAIGGAYPLN